MLQRLAPVEKPNNPLMRLAYYISQKQFGKIITPLKKVYSRLPLAFSLWANKISSLERKLLIPGELVLMARILTAQINTCNFCIDIGKAKAVKQFKDQEKFFHVFDFASSPAFNEKEKAALQFVYELTKNKEISPATYQAAARHFSEKELISLAWVVASEHVYNIMNIAFEIESDGLCAINQSSKKE